ncbi:endosulfine alpha [Oratosquilla oratoria]|uniref:endosulfine alpha n=1 Tax=Oratosquilla oratoria TaxID=337810 RepID=UPI003F76ED3A
MSEKEDNVDSETVEKNEERSKESEEETKELSDPTPNVEAAEEAKLRAKYPMVGRPMAGHSAFLQKRLQKGQKYFDSGDYQMAKQKPMNISRMPPLLAQPTGEAIPTPESVPVRKTSIIQPSKLSAS